MNRLEKIYNKGCKVLEINTIDEIEKLVNNLYEDYLTVIPEGEILKLTSKYQWNASCSLKLNICALIERNIGEYVAKKTGLTKLSTYNTAGIVEDGTFTIYVTRTDNTVIPETVEFGDEIFNVVVY